MTIDEAIENLKTENCSPQEYDKAIQLGIEALERIKEVRALGWVRFKPLPSEKME